MLRYMMSTTSALTVSTPDDLCADIARQRVQIYRVAYRLGVHPARISRYLHGHLVLTREMALAIADAIATEARDRASAEALRARADAGS
jgi:DNA-binding transcriptional regulator YdaS (Cro superfamily)